MCIGISQVVVIAEIVFAMELFEKELDCDMAETILQEEQKERKVKCVQKSALVATSVTIAELISRAYIRDYVVGHYVFVGELFLVASVMYYFTRRFSKMVQVVNKRTGISFADENNQLRCSLGCFLTTYFLRALVFGLSHSFTTKYLALWQYPLVAYCCVVLVQYLYDLLPLLIVSH